MRLTSPESARLRRAYHELFIWALYARERRLEVPRASVLFQFAMERVGNIRDVLSRAGVDRSQAVAAQWFSDAERLLVAFFDTAVRSQLGDNWSPLQKELYGHERLGQEVFDRIAVLANSPIAVEAPLEALEVFHRCLLLDYRGRAGKEEMDPDRLQRFAQKLNEALHRPLPHLSPGLSQEVVRRSFVPLIGPVWIVVAGLCMVFVMAISSYFYLYARADDVEGAVRKGYADHLACQPLPASMQ